MRDPESRLKDDKDYDAAYDVTHAGGMWGVILLPILVVLALLFIVMSFVMLGLILFAVGSFFGFLAWDKLQELRHPDTLGPQPLPPLPKHREPD